MSEEPRDEQPVDDDAPMVITGQGGVVLPKPGGGS
jgi:hypothetical protein